MNKQREEWNNHISRITEDRIVRVIKGNSPKGGRSSGTPCKHWNDSLSLHINRWELKYEKGGGGRLLGQSGKGQVKYASGLSTSLLADHLT
jgi:hypothetical protein